MENNSNLNLDSNRLDRLDSKNKWKNRGKSSGNCCSKLFSIVLKFKFLDFKPIDSNAMKSIHAIEINIFNVMPDSDCTRKNRARGRIDPEHFIFSRSSSDNLLSATSNNEEKSQKNPSKLNDASFSYLMPEKSPNL